MIWIKLDVNFAENPKVLALNDRAFRVHVRALLYAKKYNTGGELLPQAVANIGARKAIIEALVAAQLWDTTSRGGWQIHDWDDWNLPAARVEEISKERKLAGEKGGKLSGEARRKQLASGESKQIGSENREAEKREERREKRELLEPKGSSSVDAPLPPAPKTRLTVDFKERMRADHGCHLRDFEETWAFHAGGNYIRGRTDQQGFMETKLKAAVARERSNGNGRMGTGANTHSRGSSPQDDPELKRLRALGVIVE